MLSANQVGTGWFPGQRAESSPGILTGLVGPITDKGRVSEWVREDSYRGFRIARIREATVLLRLKNGSGGRHETFSRADVGCE